jgi:hypothetical protein
MLAHRRERETWHLPASRRRAWSGAPHLRPAAHRAPPPYRSCAASHNRYGCRE